MSRTDGRSLGRGLGWISVGLGAAQLVAPGAMNRLLGLADTHGQRALMRGVGLQEVTTGVGLLGSGRQEPWIWGRVAGDALHLALLGVALAEAPNRARTLRAVAAVAGIATADLMASLRLGQQPDSHAASHPLHAKATTTIGLSPDAVYAFWRQLDNLPRFMFHLQEVRTLGNGRSRWSARGPGGTTLTWEAEIVDDVPNERVAWRSVGDPLVANAGAVTFRPAPRDQGTEVTVDLEYSLPGGRVAAAIARLFGENPSQQIEDDLRRCKQILEIGEVPVSDGFPEGTRSDRQFRPRPARPE